MSTILETIAEHARERVKAEERRISRREMAETALAMGPGDGEAFVRRLALPGLAFICEVKKASPSKGVISPDFPYLEIARDYEAAGAEAISCLTEPKWFLGSDAIFREIHQRVSVPLLRKDFVVDDYQIYQARVMGAAAVLLIAALHDRQTLARRIALAGTLGMAALTEAHDGAETALALDAGAELLGVNNRNLKDFSVDFENAARLRGMIPQGVLYVAESGVKDQADIRRLREIGADAVLVGEALMRSPDRQGTLRAWKQASR